MPASGPRVRQSFLCGLADRWDAARFTVVYGGLAPAQPSAGRIHASGTTEVCRRKSPGERRLHGPCDVLMFTISNRVAMGTRGNVRSPSAYHHAGMILEFEGYTLWLEVDLDRRLGWSHSLCE